MDNLNNIPFGLDNGGTDGLIRHFGIFVGFVKGNQDAQKMGRLQVYIPELGGDPDNANNWYTVSYASPFAGATNVNNNQPGSTTMAGTQLSYGMWMIPPDVENEVLVCFANGDTGRGFWFACLYQQFMNHMVPGLGCDTSTTASDNTSGLPPVCEYNKQDPVQSANYWMPQRPTFTPLTTGLTNQGLRQDVERGPGTTSARREAPSQVFGFLTPRGNTIHIDDNPQNEFIRLRTRSGAQILIHETTGYIYMISKDGWSWMEISDIGIDMYSKRSISLRAEENINLHADHSVIMHGVGAVHTTAGNITHSSKGRINSIACGEIIRHCARIRDNSKTPTGNGQQGGSTGTGQQAAGASGASGGTGGATSSGGTGGTGSSSPTATTPEDAQQDADQDQDDAQDAGDYSSNGNGGNGGNSDSGNGSANQGNDGTGNAGGDGLNQSPSGTSPYGSLVTPDGAQGNDTGGTNSSGQSNFSAGTYSSSGGFTLSGVASQDQSLNSLGTTSSGGAGVAPVPQTAFGGGYGYVTDDTSGGSSGTNGTDGTAGSDTGAGSPSSTSNGTAGLSGDGAGATPTVSSDGFATGYSPLVQSNPTSQPSTDSSNASSAIQNATTPNTDGSTTSTSSSPSSAVPPSTSSYAPTDNSNYYPPTTPSPPYTPTTPTTTPTPTTPSNTSPNNGVVVSQQTLQGYVGGTVGTNQQCVSAVKALGSDSSGNPLGPASGWYPDTAITGSNYQNYIGQAVATANDNGQYSRVGGIPGNATHTGILVGWDSSRNEPILADQWAGHAFTIESHGASTRYGTFYTIKQ